MSQKLWTAPETPREWVITIAHPKSDTMAPVLAGDQSAMMTDDEADAYARTLPIPDGWEVIGASQISNGKRGPILPTDSRQLRVVLHPVSWRQQFTPKTAIVVYAAAQYVGMKTGMDAVMQAMPGGIQYFLPTGRPTQRHSTRWQDELPEPIRQALSEIDSIRGRMTGSMWPWDRTEAELGLDQQTQIVMGWVTAEWPQILV